MRYIDLAKLRKPPNWNARADAAAKAVAAGADPNDHSTVWRELKDALAKIFNDKCWYCESSVARSDNGVDHFRPKNRVSDAAHPHNGYRWLAFDTSNLRYSCTYCNSRRIDKTGKTAGGKAALFPLVKEQSRVYSPGPTQSESPMLLDPCHLSDWRLLGCQQENGKPCATSNEPIERKRAEVSIEAYHLDYEPTCKRRHAAAVQLMADVDDAKRLFTQLTKNQNKQSDFLKVAKRIIRSIDRDAEFSGDVHFLLRGQRSAEHPWIEELLQT